MSQVIIFPIEHGLAVIHPAAEFGRPVEEIARKDVPQGVAYKIISIDDLPQDRMFRAAWEADFSEPDGFGDPEGWWAEEEGRLEAEAAAQEAQRAAMMGGAE